MKSKHPRTCFVDILYPLLTTSKGRKIMQNIVQENMWPINRLTFRGSFITQFKMYFFYGRVSDKRNPVPLS